MKHQGLRILSLKEQFRIVLSEISIGEIENFLGTISKKELKRNFRLKNKIIKLKNQILETRKTGESK